MSELKYGDILDSLTLNLDRIRSIAGGSADLVIREIIVNNTRAAVIATEGMVNSFYFSSIITDNLCNTESINSSNPEELFNHIYDYKLISPDQKITSTIDDIFIYIYSGFGVVLIDGVNSGIVFGAQGFSFRSIDSPSTDENIKGSKEGFSEVLKINASLLRRRIKSPELVFESIRMGKESKTDCALVYMNKFVSDNMLNKVRKILKDADIDMVLESGSVKMMLTTKPLSLFSEIGTTERPDTLAKKLYEGKIGIMIDGTPFVLIVPFLFAEHFHSLDDFAYKAIYSNLIRFLKFASFVVAFLLPGLYVAVATFHPQMLPDMVQQLIGKAETSTPYSFVVEALLIHFAYEIMREAGLRLPKEIGHAVSIVGGLIIGDAAVSAGLISAPMVLIAALAVISTFVVPALMDSLVVLRFLLIILGGILGMYGIAIGIILVLVNICGKTVFGVPYASSIAPSDYRSFTTFLYKSSRQQFASAKVPKVQNMPGAGCGEKTGIRDLLKGGKEIYFLLSIISFLSAAFSLWVYTMFLKELIFPEFSFVILLIPIYVLLLACKNCTSLGCLRLSKLFTPVAAAGGIAAAFGLIFFGLTYRTLLASYFVFADIFTLMILDGIILLVFLPFYRKTGRKMVGSIILQEILCIAIALIMISPALAGLLPLSLIFYSILVFLKLDYTINFLSEVNVTALGHNGKKIKPAICTALLIGSYILYIL